MADVALNTLYYGDNLDILRRYIDDESVDLICLDPPFNSSVDYSVLFAKKDGTQAHAQIKAFEDTLTWDLEAAQELAAADKYQFQYWALGLVGARPVEQKKGADQGIDGRLYLSDSAGETQTIILQVKAGHVTSSQVRDLRGVIEREGAAIGVFISLEPATGPMRKEAADAGFFQSKAVSATKHPRLQILTIEELLAGQKIDMPLQTDVRSFKQAPKAKGKKAAEPKLF